MLGKTARWKKHTKSQQKSVQFVEHCGNCGENAEIDPPCFQPSPHSFRRGCAGNLPGSGPSLHAASSALGRTYGLPREECSGSHMWLSMAQGNKDQASVLITGRGCHAFDVPPTPPTGRPGGGEVDPPIGFPGFSDPPDPSLPPSSVDRRLLKTISLLWVGGGAVGSSVSLPPCSVFLAGVRGTVGSALCPTRIAYAQKFRGQAISQGALGAKLLIFGSGDIGRLHDQFYKH